MTVNLGVRWALAIAMAVGSVGCGNEEDGAGAGGGSASFPLSPTALPCDVARVFADNCASCHAGGTPLFGAPMPLVGWEDMIRTVAWENPSRPDAVAPNVSVGEQVYNRIHHATNPMPPVQVANRLDQNEMAILDTWLRAPTPRLDGDTCQGQGGTGGVSGIGGTGGVSGIGGVGGTAGTGGVSGIGGTGGVGGDSGVGGTGGMSGNGGTGGDSGTGGTDVTEPYVGVPPDCAPENTYEFRAHGTATVGDSSAYNVSQRVPSGNRYECFTFKAPWGSEAVQGVYFEPITGDTRTLHHWILYANENGSGASNGAIGNCGDKGYFVQGWAPGGEETQLPRNVGMQMPSGTSANFTLEVHYNNAARHADSTDRSGVKVCVTKTFREHTAAVHWLGTENIGFLPAIGPGQAGTARGTCDPSGNQTATILSVSPHMHQQGTHMTTIINRAGGGTETLHDGAFQFENQISYAKRPPVIINPGDTLRTTCSYMNTSSSAIRFGPDTEDEMCYNFVLAYPVGSLANASGNRCTGVN